MKNSMFLISFLISFLSFSQEKSKDSLFIDYNESLMNKYKHPIENYNYYLINETGNNGSISFKEKYIHHNLKPKRIYSIKDVIKKAKAYYVKNDFKKDKINDYKLAKYLGDYIVFFVFKNKIIEVQTWIEEI